jgi:DNA-binding LacI/PurR family transcriptional regulator
MKVTMRDVALRAGVDKATVSRVLAGDPRISEKTRMRVAAAVRELNYRVDRNASALSASKSRLIGAVFSDLSAPWLGPFLSGLERVVSASGRDLIVKSTEGRAERAALEFARLSDRSAEGVIWEDGKNLPEVRDMPFVALGFSAAGLYSISSAEGGAPTFEIGALAGRMILRLVSGKHVPRGGLVVRGGDGP